MKRKIVDTNIDIMEGGRANRYWYAKSPKPNNWSGGGNYELDLQLILKSYKIKGFEFGNWLNNNDRYDRVLACSSALAHLSAIIGSKNIGMDYLVGIAFGARGNSRALAHYEPSYNMINITKEKGMGTMAHEYGHALDYNIGNFVDQNKKHAYLSGGRITINKNSSSAQNRLKDNVGEIRSLMENLLMKASDTDSFKKMSPGSGGYWLRRTEIFARAFEQYVCYILKCNGIRDKFLTNSWSFYTTMEHYWTENDFFSFLPEMTSLIHAISKKMNVKAHTVTGKGKIAAKK